MREVAVCLHTEIAKISDRYTIRKLASAATTNPVGEIAGFRDGAGGFGEMTAGEKTGGRWELWRHTGGRMLAGSESWRN